MKYVHDLRDNYSIRLTISGGKGANLHKLIRYGFKVPDGFVLNTKAFDLFLAENKLILVLRRELASVRIDDYDSIVRASKRIKDEINNAIFPDKVLRQMQGILSEYPFHSFSVRSSGVFEDNSTNSWAGQFDSFLQVDKNDLPSRIKACWASFFNSQAISYNIRAYKNVKKLKFAVVVQRMVHSEKSGVAFSIEPQKMDFDKIVIEATPGFGENLVSGRNRPFSAVFDKKRKILIEKSSNTNQYSDLLTITELKTILDKIVRIEKKMNSPVDVEWSFENGELLFLQVRPITGLVTRIKSLKIEGRLPDISNYEVTFRASGISFLFADILAYAYKHLDPLFVSDKLQFYQYIAKDKIEYAGRYGVNLFSRVQGFKEYRDRFEKYYLDNLDELNEIANQKKITTSSTHRFFNILTSLFKYYSKMDSYYTNLAYVYSQEDEKVRDNLNSLSQFKDVARLWINNVAINDDGQLRAFMLRIGQDYSIQKSELECYKIEDIYKLFWGVFLSDKEIESRKTAYAIYYINRQRSYLSGNKASEFENRIEFRLDRSNDNRIQGQVANMVHKIVRGRVKLINVDYGNIEKMNRRISEMERGEILVSEFTAPELIAACKKAKAIITDMGGMLSHAAIISRELNVPCLVGTGNATRTLKTGDLVQIDFHLGLVTKL